MSVSATYESEYTLIVPYNEAKTIAPISTSGTIWRFSLSGTSFPINSSTGVISTEITSNTKYVDYYGGPTQIKVWSDSNNKVTIDTYILVCYTPCSICDRDIYFYVNNNINKTIAEAVGDYSGQWIFDSVSLQDLSYEIYNEEPYYELIIKGTVNSLKIIEVNFNIKDIYYTLHFGTIDHDISNTFTVRVHIVDPLIVRYNNANYYKNDYISILPVIDQGIGIKYYNYRVYNNETGVSNGDISNLKLSLNSNTGEIYGTSDVYGSWKIIASIDDGVQTHETEFILNIIDNHCTNCINCTNCFYCTNCKDCSNCTSCSNCIYCNDCTNVY